jgi:hypothetical protein
MGKKKYTKQRRLSRKKNNYKRKKSLTKRGGSSSFSDTPMSWEERLNRERPYLSDPLNRRADLNNYVSPLMQQLNPAKLIVGSNQDRHQIRERIRGRDCLCGLELQRVMRRQDKRWSDMISEIQERNEYLERENRILKKKYTQMLVSDTFRSGPELGSIPEFEPHSIPGSKGNPVTAFPVRGPLNSSCQVRVPVKRVK